MSEQAQREYLQAQVAQVHQNDARRIRTKVDAARKGDRPQAGRRWPFEILQNAHDPGTRDGRSRVDVDFAWDGSDLRVSHNGKVFTAQELAALLSGGSSKDYDDESTTGRFGTGFLVTHALSTEVDVKGLLATDAGVESFSIELRRGGDEVSIVANIGAAEEALGNAEVVQDYGDLRTVTLTYRGADPEVVAWGLERLEQALPYLYATCPFLGEVEVVRPDGARSYSPGDREDGDGGALFVEQGVVIKDPGGDRTVTAMRVSTGRGARAAVLALVEDGALLSPPQEFPRIFVQFPIAGTQFLPFEVVIDGRFTPQQERNGLLMGDDDRDLLEEALSVMPKLAMRATQEGWRGGHRLAYLAAPARTFTTEEESGEAEWWKRTVRQVAEGVARESVILTTAGWLPAVAADGPKACFVAPSYDADSALMSRS